MTERTLPPAIARYLRRIGHDGPTAPALATLRALHLAHLRAVPFENLDIHIGREIVLDEARLTHKIVVEQRGGFCYELNGAFAWLLRGLGFDVTLLSVRVARAGGGFGPEFDHLLLRVDLDTPWLADVGFGESFLEPLPLRHGIYEQHGKTYRLDADGDDWTLLQHLDDDWQAQHRFSLTPRQLAEFAGMCHYQQTSPESHFTRGRVCTRATPAGRLTLRDDRLIVTEAGVRHEEPIADDDAWRAALRDHFGIALPAEAERFVVPIR